MLNISCYIASYIAHAQFSQQMDNTSKVLSTNPDKVGVWAGPTDQVRSGPDKTRKCVGPTSISTF